MIVGINPPRNIFLLLTFLLINLTYQDENIFNLTQTFLPYSLTLLNNEKILVINNGIHFFDSELKNEYTFKYIPFSPQIETTQTSDFNKITIAQFPQEYNEYIMVLALNKMYFFENSYNILTSIDLSSYLDSSYYCLLPYKKESDYLHFIISHIHSDTKNFSLDYFQYNINDNNIINSISKKVNVSLQYYGNNAIPSILHGASCLFLTHTTLNKDLLVCFYSIFYPTEIHARVFDPDTLEEKTEFFKYFFDSESTGRADYLSALTNDEKKKAFIVYNNGNPSTLIFDFNEGFSSNKLQSNDQYFNGVTSDYYRNKFFYNKNLKQFVYSSTYSNSGVFPIMIFDNNFNRIEIGNHQAPSNIFGIFTTSPIYIDENLYILYDNANIVCINIEEVTGLTQVTDEVETTPTTTPTTTSTTVIETTGPSFTKNIKCKTATLESSNYDLCTECDNDNGYYSVDLDDSYLHGFVECYKSETKPSNFYFDSLVSKFKLCYQSCKKCNNGGDVNIQNCLECDDNYIKEPDKDSTNCVVACNYMYYYNNFGQYKCTVENKCPDEYKLYIEELKKCTNDCSKEDIYKYKYGGKCLKNCPENTSKKEEDRTCIDIDLDSCSKTENEFLLKNELDLDEIDLNAKNYAEEFSYTDKHVSYYYNDLYSILFYKDSTCIEELSLKMPKVDFGNCYSKILDNLDPPTTDKIIIVLIEKINKQKKSSTTYLFYHPNTGQKIDAATICKGEEIIIKQSVLSQLNNSNVNIDDVLFLAKQNIDVFNISDQFYTDLCFHFDSPNGKDIPLKDRMLTYYPNVTLCDEGCETKGVNLTTMESMCECTFSDIMNLGDNALLQNTLGGITDLLSSSNIFVLKCYKDVFDQKYFIKNTGGFIIISLTILEIILSILFFAIDITQIFSNLYILTESFINSIKSKKIYKNTNDNFLTLPTENAPPRKNESSKYIKRTKTNKIKTRKFKVVSYNNDNNDENRNTTSTEKIDSNLEHKKIKKSKTSHLKMKKKSTVGDEIEYFDFDEAIQDFSPNLKPGEKPLNKNIDIDEFLKPDLDDMDYDDAVKYDKRPFCLFYWERLKDKQMILNIILKHDILKPITMKLLLLVLNIELYFVVNGLFYSEDYISELYYSTEEENFFSFFTRSINRFFYTTIVGVIVEYIIGFIFTEEKKIKKIFLREKDNFQKLKYQIFKVIKNCKTRFIIFIILCFIVSFISWYYVNCFNNVYPGVKIEWIKSSIVIIIIMQLLPVVTAFLEAILRGLSFRCKNEKLFELKQYLS